eukprot:2473788-Pleurochrysis_carterae.AAC.2
MRSAASAKSSGSEPAVRSCAWLLATADASAVAAWTGVAAVSASATWTALAASGRKEDESLCMDDPRAPAVDAASSAHLALPSVAWAWGGVSTGSGKEIGDAGIDSVSVDSLAVASHPLPLDDEFSLAPWLRLLFSGGGPLCASLGAAL